MKCEIEEMRKELLGDDRNEFLMERIFENTVRREKHYGPSVPAPIIRQTGRTTMRVLEGLHKYKTSDIRVVYFEGWNSRMSNRLMEMFEDFRKKLNIPMKPDTWYLTNPRGTDHDFSPAIYVKDHPMP